MSLVELARFDNRIEAELVRHDGTIPGAAYVAHELMDAVAWILGQTGFPREMA